MPMKEGRGGGGGGGGGVLTFTLGGPATFAASRYIFGLFSHIF